MITVKKILRQPNIPVSGPAAAFLFNLAAGLVSFLWTIIAEGGLFSLAGDFNSQQITFAIAANEAIKSGNVIWDWSLDLGSNFIGGMSFYILGNPSFWVSLLFPAKYFMYVVGWLYLLKYAFAGLFSYYYLERLVKHKETAVIGSMLYAFSGYTNEALLFYHFHDVVVWFPLLLITFDDLVKKGKRGPFIFAVCINAVVNYFFFVGEVLFVIAYYGLKYLVPAFKKYIRRLPRIIIESVTGVMIGAVLLLPSFIFTIQNPRVENDYTGSNSLVFSGERYLYILKGLIFPGEMMSHQSAVIKNNFSSCCAYLPVVGMVLVIAFFMLHKKHWLNRMLKFCLLMAVVPILNASFSLFAGLYCRWYYMAVLMMAGASVMVLDEWMSVRGNNPQKPLNYVERAVRKSALIWGSITAAFVLFLVFVKWSKSEPSKIYNKPLFAAFSIVSVAGTVLTWHIICRLRQKQIIYLALSVFVFSCATCITDIAMLQAVHGRGAQEIYDELNTTAALTDPAPYYRFTSRDNIETLAHNRQGSANFCSTVSGSIFRFYEALGLERDVKSPDAPEGMMNLISARYAIEDEPREDETFIEERSGKDCSFYVYEDKDVPPIGFTYDTYMTATELEGIASANRAVAMLRTLVIPDEEEEKVSEVLAHYSKAVHGGTEPADIPEASRAHLSECAREAVRTTSSYGVTITADADKYAFFSIPNDSGWAAKVNGEDAEILDASGFMAVRIHEGENRIEFTYTVPGLFAGIIISLAGLLAAAVYIGYWVIRKRKAQ